MIHWKQIKDLEKDIAHLVIKLYDNHQLEDDINKCIIHQIYKKIHFKKDKKNLIITFNNCIVKSKIITNKSFNIDVCCVCYDSCPLTLKCGHYVCDSCIKDWFKNNNTCPMCRKTDNYQVGYSFTIPLRIVKLSLHTQSGCCWKKNTKRLRPIRYLNNLLQKSRKVEDNSYVYKWTK